MKIDEMGVGREVCRSIRHGLRRDRDHVIGRIQVIETQLDGGTRWHAAAATNQSHGERIVFSGIKGRAKFLEDGHLRHGKKKHRLRAITVIDVFAREGNIIEFPDQIRPGRTAEIGGTIPSGLRWFLPVVHGRRRVGGIGADVGQLKRVIGDVDIPRLNGES